jgi:hypothetical protein
MVQRPSELARFFLGGMRVLTNRPEPLQSFNCVVYAKIPRNTFFYGEGRAKFPKNLQECDLFNGAGEFCSSSCALTSEFATPAASG